MPETKSWRKHQGEVVDSVKGFDVIECQTCGFKHIIPIVTAEEMEEYYSEQFHQERPLYINRYQEDLDWWRMVYDERYEMFEKYLPPGCRRILDIGCGLGVFLQKGKERGWETIGIEPSWQRAEYARHLGLEIINEPFSQKHVEDLGRFDVVHMHELLEHIPNPTDILRPAHQLLEPHGLLCAVVPNDYNPLQRVLCEQLGYKPWWVVPPLHINYFDFDSLERLLQRTGFEVVYKTTTFPMELFLLMGDNYVGNDEMGRMCHRKRKNYELLLNAGGLSHVKQRLYESLSHQQIGRTVVLFARK